VLVHATPTQADAITRAMKCVATGDGVVALSAVDVAAIKACHHVILHRQEPLDVAALSPISPTELAGLVGGGGVGEHAVQFLAVIALVDGSVRAERVEAVARYSAALGLFEDYLDELIAAGEGRLQWAIADMSRRNVVSISDGRLRPDDFALWPYRDAPDPALADRYRGLGILPRGTLGAEFHRWYATHGFAFPGEPAAVNEAFTCPHDSTHLLSGYSTSPQGELLVSTFTAGIHPLEPMAGHVLPVIFSWHLGIQLNPLAGSWTGALHPRKFWVAWERGAETIGDPFAADWDFWALAETPLEDLKRRYAIPPLDPHDAAAEDRPQGFSPVA
jgi:hypothetical protein